MQDLLKKLEAIQYRFAEVGTLIVDPDIISDMSRYVKLNKEYKDLEEIVSVYKEYKNVLENLENGFTFILYHLFNPARVICQFAFIATSVSLYL